MIAAYAKDIELVVFNGHVHTTEMYDVDGVKYLVLGGGGAEQDPILPGRTSIKMPATIRRTSTGKASRRDWNTTTSWSMSNRARRRNSPCRVTGPARRSRSQPRHCSHRSASVTAHICGDNTSNSARLGRGGVAWCDHASGIGSVRASEAKPLSFFGRFRAVPGAGFTNADGRSVFGLLAARCDRLPVFQDRCSANLERDRHWHAMGYFDLKEDFVVIGLGLLPAYWFCWRRPVNGQNALIRTITDHTPGVHCLVVLPRWSRRKQYRRIRVVMSASLFRRFAFAFGAAFALFYVIARARGFALFTVYPAQGIVLLGHAPFAGYCRSRLGFPRARDVLVRMDRFRCGRRSRHRPSCRAIARSLLPVLGVVCLHRSPNRNGRKRLSHDTLVSTLAVSLKLPAPRWSMSKADMWSAIADVCYVPLADKPSLAANWRGGAVTR